MTIIMNPDQVQDPVLLVSQIYPCVYTSCTEVPHQGGPKPRRRRKKTKGGETSVGTKKRKLSQEQVNLLELNFGNEHKLESERKDRIAAELGLDPRQVAVWFQNRRARWKNKKLEEEYSRLKSSHENVVVENYRLESEVMKLKEQLCEAKKEIQRLAERVEGVSSNSTPSSSLSVDAVDPPFLGEFEVEEYENVLYMPEPGYVNGLDWINLYM
ncbi:hypothetical protein SLA2020_132870 [Shorea laevis]